MKLPPEAMTASAWNRWAPGWSPGATWWVIAGFSLLLRSGFPIHAIGDAGLDDALFIRQARSLGAGEWLGPFGNTTLVKGMFYPLFILGAFLAGIPLKLAEQAAYLLAAASAARLAWPGRRPWSATLLFAALAFNPVPWTVELSRVMREGLYVSLSLAVVALLVAAVFMPGRAMRAAGRGVLLGLVAGACWITREEGVWLLPAVVTVLGLRLFAWTGARGLRPVAVALAGALCGGALVVGANVAMNRHVYGLPLRLEVTSPAFEHAYGALSRISHQQWRRYVVFPADARQLAYRVSPAARTLEPFLEGEVGQRWQRASCADSPGIACPEILASWFQWALRDAVAGAGHYASLPETEQFYARLAQEIDAGCDAGAIPCLPPRATLAPPFRWHYLRDALDRAATLAPLLARLGGDAVRTDPSTGPEEQIGAFEDTVGPVLRRPSVITEIRGRVQLAAGPARLALRPATGTMSRTDIALTPGPGGGETSFLVSSTCPVEACDLVLWSGDAAVASIPFGALLAPVRIERPGLVLMIEATNQHLVRRGQNSRTAAFGALARPIGRAYAAIMPVLALLGTVGVLLVPALRRWDVVRSPLFALVAASLVACLSRLALVAYLDVTAIPSVGVLYLSPATPFVILLGVGGVLLLASCRRPEAG